MFAIIISEKGGAERRESFDKNEINVGRVQGNDLMLPKGNVSKHHARLLFRDGRFIVTDLKSTNGTYVNGRKIAQATIVREGDKIYIGDFVLRLETNGAGDATATPEGDLQQQPMNVPPPPMNLGGPPPLAGPPQPRPAAPAVTLKAPTHPPGAPLPRPMPSNVSNASPLGMSAMGQQPVNMPPLPAPHNFTQEQDSDDSGLSPQAPQKRGQSNMPPALANMPVGGGRPLTMPLNQMSPPPIARGAPPPHAVPPNASPQPAPIAPLPLPPIAASSPQPAPVIPPAPLSQPAPGRATAPPPRQPPKETPAQAGRRLALMTLLDRVADAVDLGALQKSPEVSEALASQIEKVAREQAAAMRDEGDAPEGIDLDSVAREAHRELVGLGPFAQLLDDEEVGEIHAVRFDQLFTLRGGAHVVSEATAFSSEEALQRIIARLAHQSGEPVKPGETVIERRLNRASFVAIAPPVSAGHLVSIRKRRRVEATLNELVQAGSISKPMSQFLEACINARTNIIISGNAPMPLLSALTTVGGNSGERVVVVHDVEEIGVGNAHVATLACADTRKAGEECVRAAAKLRSDRLVITQLAGGIAAATVDAMTEGSEGVLGALSAPTLRQGLSRLVAQLVLHRPGLSLEGMREVVGDAFDIAIEIGLFPDGRLRVTRIAELGGADAKGVVTRDLFVFNADPTGGDGSFSATGVVPRIANDLAARGTKLDPAMFKRIGR